MQVGSFLFNFIAISQNNIQCKLIRVCLMTSCIMIRSFILPFKLLWVLWNGSHDFDMATLVSLDPSSYADLK